MAEKVKECISNSAAEYMRVREEEKEKGGGESRVKRNTLACIILREKEALGIPPAVNINFETVRTRAKRKNNQGTNTARISPMLEVEPYIVELIDQLGKMRLAITCQEGLQLANSLVNGKLIMKNIQIWCCKHCISFRDYHQPVQSTTTLPEPYMKMLPVFR